MSTRSSIAVRKNDNEILNVSCHWDGYIEHNGKLLIHHYNTKEKALKLIRRGDISSLSDNIDKTIYQNEYMNDVKRKPIADFDDMVLFEYNYKFDDMWYVKYSDKDWHPLQNYFLTEVRKQKIKEIFKK